MKQCYASWPVRVGCRDDSQRAMTYAKLTTRPAKTPYGAITIASIFIIIMAG
jgi:hypothetical protein